MVNAPKEPTEERIAELLKFKVPIVSIRDRNQYIYGPPEFTEFIKDYEKQFSNLLPPVSK